jgi:hypothetical protein
MHDNVAVFCSQRIACVGGNPAVQVNNYGLSQLVVANAANIVWTTAVPAIIYDLSH